MNIIDKINQMKCKKKYTETVNKLGPFHNTDVEVVLHGTEESFKLYFELLDINSIKYTKTVSGDIIYVKARRIRKDENR